MSSKTTEKETITIENKFTKSSILSSKKYKNRKPILIVLLADDKEYSINEVDKLIDNYMKGKVK